MKQLNIGQSNVFHCKQSIDLYRIIMKKIFSSLIQNGGKFDIDFSIQKETQIFCCKWDTQNFYKSYKEKVT